MSKLTRRALLKASAGGLAGMVAWPLVGGVPSVAARRRPLVLRPFPHAQMPTMDFAYASDENGDAFEAPISVTSDGIVVSEDITREFAVNARWYVEGFGFVWLAADNGGQLFTADDLTQQQNLNLNYEFARSRVERNNTTLARYGSEGATFSAEVQHLHALSQELFEEAGSRNDPERIVEMADKSLLYALWAGEKIELEKARSDIARRQRVDEFFFGCETRQYIWARSEPFADRFAEVFNFATVTHYIWDSWYEVFEPEEGKYRWGIKDNIVDWLVERNITIEGRPLFWFHPVVTPDWLRDKDFDSLKGYVERHTEALVGHYGDRVHHWEVVNEYHDWANIHNHTPEQITEIVRLACDKTRDVNPQVERLINNCCPFGEYVSYRHAAHGEASRPLRTPRQFVRDIIDAGVDFEVLGVQVYFPERDLSEIVRLVERFATFEKPIYITELGATSGTEDDSSADGTGVYDWHRPWDQELQADWLEQVYTLFYSKPYIQAVNWYDFADFRTFIKNGGIVKEDLAPKLAYGRLRNLLSEWDRLPQP